MGQHTQLSRELPQEGEKNLVLVMQSHSPQNHLNSLWPSRTSEKTLEQP